MFGSIKKAMVAGAVVATAALAGPAMASAAFPTWSPAGAAEGGGTLTLTLGASQTTCDVDFTIDLVNDGTMDGGDVTSFNLTNCSSNDPRCAVSATADVTPPWDITKFTSDTDSVGINGVNFTNSYSGATCPLNGVNLNATGNIVGDYDGSTGTLSFNNATGLTTVLGNPTVSGAVEIVNEGTGLPVDLV